MTHVRPGSFKDAITFSFLSKDMLNLIADEPERGICIMKSVLVKVCLT